MPFVGMRKPWGPLGPMRPKKFAEKMSVIAAMADDDTELAHVEADDLMCDVLKSLGYADGVRIFDKMGKWYA